MMHRSFDAQHFKKGHSMSVLSPTSRGSLSNPINGTFARRLGIMLALLIALGLPGGRLAFAEGGREIRIKDGCDPTTFNAALGPGACVGDGEVTFNELLARLNPQDGGHPAWAFTPGVLTIRAGENLRLRNRGGETHTFTEVLAFGAGIVPPLNAALPPGTPFVIPATADFPGPFLAAGQRMELRNLSVGSHLFQCVIHPWMRTVVQVEAH